MTGDLKEVEFFITESLPQQIRDGAILIGAGVLFVSYSGAIAFLPIVTALFLAWLNLRVQRRLSPILGELRSLHGSILQLLLESMEGIRTIRSYSVERFIQKRFEGKIDAIMQKGMNVVRILGVLLGSNQFLSQIMVTVCLTFAAWGLYQGQLTLSEILIYPFFIGMFFNSAQNLASSTYQWNRYFIEGGRLAQLLYGDSVNRDEWFRVLHNECPFSLEAAERLQVSQVEIGFTQRKLTAPFDFDIRRGEVTAITGPSGCGKSTFLEFLAGLRSALGGDPKIYNSLGGCIWDGSSREHSKLPVGLSAYVEQCPYLFKGSIQENLTFGNDELASDREIWESLDRVGLGRHIRSLGGLTAVLKDRGLNLSEGQRYRLTLARGLLLKRPFLLLDEPFAALDTASSALVIEAIELERRHAGIVVVTHHVPYAFKCDCVINFQELNESISKFSLFGVKASKRVLKIGEKGVNRLFVRKAN